MNRDAFEILFSPLLEKYPEASPEVALVKEAYDGILKSKQNALQDLRESRDRCDLLEGALIKCKREYGDFRVKMRESTSTIVTQLRYSLWKLEKNGISWVPDEVNGTSLQQKLDVLDVGSLYALLDNEEWGVVQDHRKERKESGNDGQ